METDFQTSSPDHYELETNGFWICWTCLFSEKRKLLKRVAIFHEAPPFCLALNTWLQTFLEVTQHLLSVRCLQRRNSKQALWSPALIWSMTECIYIKQFLGCRMQCKHCKARTAPKSKWLDTYMRENDEDTSYHHVHAGLLVTMVSHPWNVYQNCSTQT